MRSAGRAGRGSAHAQSQRSHQDSSGETADRRNGHAPAPGRASRFSVAFNAASQMALLYPPGIDELMRRERRGGERPRARGGGLH